MGEGFVNGNDRKVSRQRTQNYGIYKKKTVNHAWEAKKHKIKNGFVDLGFDIEELSIDQAKTHDSILLMEESMGHKIEEIEDRWEKVL